MNDVYDRTETLEISLNGGWRGFAGGLEKLVFREVGVGKLGFRVLGRLREN